MVFITEYDFHKKLTTTKVECVLYIEMMNLHLISHNLDTDADKLGVCKDK